MKVLSWLHAHTYVHMCGLSHVIRTCWLGSLMCKSVDMPTPSLLAWENMTILSMPMSLFVLHSCKRLNKL